jgi:hypothetical protein
VLEDVTVEGFTFGAPVGPIDFIDRADVGMVQCRRSSCFALKSLNCLLILRQIVGQKLECHASAQFRVLSLVHYTHPASAEFLDNAVVQDGLADHWRETLGVKARQVNESDWVVTCQRGCGENLNYTT